MLLKQQSAPTVLCDLSVNKNAEIGDCDGTHVSSILFYYCFKNYQVSTI